MADSNADAPTLRVLFVGNSFTHFHDLPNLVASRFADLQGQLQASSDGGNNVQLQCEVLTKGGAALALWLNDKKGEMAAKVAAFKPQVGRRMDIDFDRFPQRQTEFCGCK